MTKTHKSEVLTAALTLKWICGDLWLSSRKSSPLRPTELSQPQALEIYYVSVSSEWNASQRCPPANGSPICLWLQHTSYSAEARKATNRSVFKRHTTHKSDKSDKVIASTTTSSS